MKKKFEMRNSEVEKAGNRPVRLKLNHLTLKAFFAVFFLLSTFAFPQGNVNVINPPSRPANVKVVSGTISATGVGATFQANSQVTATTTAGTLLAARPTRRSALIRNTDAAISVYIGAATVTAGNGMLLKAGESVVVTSITLLQVIAASGTPVVAIFDEYD